MNRPPPLWLLADDDLHDGDLWLNGLFSGQVPSMKTSIMPLVCGNGALHGTSSSQDAKPTKKTKYYLLPCRCYSSCS